MKSTGEVMGVGYTFGSAFAKGQLAAGEKVPDSGLAFISVKDSDKQAAVEVARELLELNYKLCATHGTEKILREAGLECEGVNKVREGQPHIVDKLKNDEIDLIINTTEGKQAIKDSFSIRRTALQHSVFYTTTMAGAKATTASLRDRKNNKVFSLQELHAGITS